MQNWKQVIIDGIATSPNIGSQVFIDGISEYSKKYAYITRLANNVCIYNFLLETYSAPEDKNFLLVLKANEGYLPKRHATGSAHTWSDDKLYAFNCYSDYRHEGFLFKPDWNPVTLADVCPIGSWLRVEGHFEYKEDPSWI